MKIKSTKKAWLCIIPALLLPVLVQAEPTGTGSVAASQAADQREALAKKTAERQAKIAEAERQKAGQAQISSPQEKPPVESNKDEAAAQ